MCYQVSQQKGMVKSNMSMGFSMIIFCKRIDLLDQHDREWNWWHLLRVLRGSIVIGKN